MQLKLTRGIKRFILRHRMLIILSALLLLIISFPFVQSQPPQMIVSMEFLFTLFLITGVNAVTKNKKIVAVSLLLVIMSFTVAFFEHYLNIQWLLIFALCLQIIFFIIATFTLIHHVLQYKKVSADKIYGAVCGYLLLGIIWAMIYTVIEIAYPHSFVFSNGLSFNYVQASTHRLYFTQFLYYSYITLSTLGYGDIVPIGLEARAFASLQAITGQLYVAVLIARLVGLHISHTLLSRKD